METTSGTFVAIPTDRLTECLEAIGVKIAGAGGRLEKIIRGGEIVYEFALPPSATRSEFIITKVYTSIAKDAQSARDCGEDAIRIVVGSISAGEFKPVGFNATIKRTAPREAPDRVGVFLERLTGKIREAYVFGRGTPLCPCGHHMSKRKGAHGEFWGCTTYPVCRNTKKI